MRLPIEALLLTLVATPIAASDLSLSWPVDCTLGENCHIQQYVDHDPGPGAQDYRCAPLSYQGHKGTDIGIPYLTEVQRGIAVRAAAPGVVVGLRDRMPDLYATEENAESLKGRECGNGVVLRHEGGWETQYCHMKLGSVQVQKGQKVQAGTQLGEIGLSGKTQFPHLHLAVRHNGEIVDPFAPDGSDSTSCETAPTAVDTAAATGAGLWAEPVPYQPGGFLGVGFNTAVPEFQAIKSGNAAVSRLSPDSPALVFWAYAFGGQAADRVRLSISGPEGVFSVHEVTLERNQAQFFRASGKRLRNKSWVQGRYSGVAVLIRDDVEIDRIEQEIVVR